MRYWPTRVDEKCQNDPSLGVAHGCFWKYHPARAWAWELRLQDEIGPDFRIEEAPYSGRRRPRGPPRRLAARPSRRAPSPRSRRRPCADAEARRQPRAELRILEAGPLVAHPRGLLGPGAPRLARSRARSSACSHPTSRTRARRSRRAHPEKVSESRKRFLASLAPPGRAVRRRGGRPQRMTMRRGPDDG